MSQEKIVIRWDVSAQPAQWSVEILRENHEGRDIPALSSSDPGFPVNVKDFGPLDEDALISSIKASFPEAHINMRF